MLNKHPWLTFLLPLFVFMLVGSFEPTPESPGGGTVGLAIPYAYYPAVYTLRIVLTLAAMLLVLPGYRQFSLRLSPLAVLFGLVGGAIWIGICELELESRLLGALGIEGFLDLGARGAFNPFQQFAGSPALAWGFLAVRFLGLVAVVAVIEEFFLRGFLMRWVVDADWEKVPFGKVTPAAAIVGTVVPMASHPAELIAAAVWFSMITWLMVRTRNIWDCVAAHGLTNLVLGLYVVAVGGSAWRLL